MAISPISRFTSDQEIPAGMWPVSIARESDDAATEQGPVILPPIEDLDETATEPCKEWLEDRNWSEYDS